MSKRQQLDKLAKTIPKAGKSLAGKKYFEANELIANGIHFKPKDTLDIYPKWVGDAEIRERLKNYSPVPAGKVKIGDIVVYSVGDTLPHSGRVTAVNKNGEPTMIRSKWGEHSLFDHPPTAVPDYYGTPNFFRKK
jgi:hypothetical protein